MTDDRNDHALDFAPEGDAGSPAIRLPGWKILIVDDEPGIHQVTGLALAGFEFDGRGVEFLHAYSGAEGLRLMSEHGDIALAIVDVVMESEHAGLDLVQAIRRDLKNKMIRLILRTGQPGQAPERTVIRAYDINDYKEKSELSAQKLFSAVLTSLRSYRDLVALDANRKGLQGVIHASARIFEEQGMSRFIQSVLEQLIALLYLERDSMLINCDTLAVEACGGEFNIVAATGAFAGLVGKKSSEELPRGLREVVNEVLASRRGVSREGVYAGYFCPRAGREDVIYVSASRTLTADDEQMIELFLRNVAIAYDNLLLRDEIEGTQRDIVYMLGEAIETRSRETGQHVRRVAEYCYLMARGLGLSERDAQILRAAAPLHDFGKIGVPDSILHKPGKLDADEWVVMRTHSEVGEALLSRSEREILRAAALLAGQHHEKWDGSGYPRGLAGEEIHLYGRIGAVADVFDALSTRRAYKDAWPQRTVLDYLQSERGRHFDPRLVDWVTANVDAMEAIRLAYPDEEAGH